MDTALPEPCRWRVSVLGRHALTGVFTPKQEHLPKGHTDLLVTSVLDMLLTDLPTGGLLAPRRHLTQAGLFLASAHTAARFRFLYIFREDGPSQKNCLNSLQNGFCLKTLSPYNRLNYHVSFLSKPPLFHISTGAHTGKLKSQKTIPGRPLSSGISPGTTRSTLINQTGLKITSHSDH